MQSESSNICIIGGGGFIGTYLRTFLSARGYTIFTIGRSLNIPLLENERYFSIAEYSFKQLEEILHTKALAAIIDLAYSSVPNTSYDDPVKDFSENLYNVIRHLEFATATKTRKYIYVSSGGTVYGDAPGKSAFTEEAPNFPLSPYGITKLACERYVYMFHRINALPMVIVRPSNIYGPGQKPFRGQGLVATALGLAAKGEPIHVFGNGSNIRDYLYITDFCAAMLDALEYGENGTIYNIGSGVGVSIMELITLINANLEADHTTLSQTFHPERPFDVHYNVLNPDKLMRLHNWAPQTDLNEGIRATWQWIRKYLTRVK